MSERAASPLPTTISQVASSHGAGPSSRSLYGEVFRTQRAAVLATLTSLERQIAWIRETVASWPCSDFGGDSASTMGSERRMDGAAVDWYGHHLDNVAVGARGARGAGMATAVIEGEHELVKEEDEMGWGGTSNLPNWTTIEHVRGVQTSVAEAAATSDR